ncbi:phospholipid carrier-dependent glycosyltransferase [Prochlorococcus sp. MIT 1341]|uniref:phospholipid carrier-dependent glycosyltransferase n=1 Tax=Prochlorococcus sp. MIT 1341 TaxID=3096221 RepID=UPI002A751D70|nr:phospholipid carrier-dependent glycosyltransferase [Prochlorococcus sp. MIT 1341]
MNSNFRFWVFVTSIWVLSTIVDRVWWSHYAGLPSWDQADYLNSALDHGRALGLLPGGQWKGVAALLDLSPKIPPLASLVNGTVIALAGDSPSQAAWSLSLWHGMLLFGVALWGLRLSGQIVALLSVVFVAITPALLQLRLDYLLEMPLTAVMTLAISSLGSWWHPKTGEKWSQVFTAALLCLSAVMIKQSALLLLIPMFFYASWNIFTRSKTYRYQLFSGVLVVVIGVLPWLHHNWITTLGGTNRAVIESAAREGDPMLWTLENWIWYPRILPGQLGSAVLLVGVSGLVLLILRRQKSCRDLLPDKLFADDSYEWRWLICTLVGGWLLTSISPNKGDRYIAPLLPLLVLLLARGWMQWNIWLRSRWPIFFKGSFSYLLFASVFAVLPASWLSQKSRLSQRHEGPLEEIVIAAGGANPNLPPTTLIVVPSTPDLNQHNVSYFGRRTGGNLVGRQLGSSKDDIDLVLKYAQWLVLAEGDQGSVRDSALLLDRAVRASDVFVMVRSFPRGNGDSYSLWRRSPEAPSFPTFASTFPSLAIGLSQGLKGLEPVFSAVAVHHMLDGHFLYQDRVREIAVRKLAVNALDADAHWSLALLSVLANRPGQAAKHFAVLEKISPENPWPSIYQCVVTIANWNPWKAKAIANEAQKIHSNPLLFGIADLSSVLSGAVWRLPQLKRSLPKSIEVVEKSLSSSG